MIEVSHISKRYGKVLALSDVSFSVGKGELFGLIGPDGAGKTSLYRILCTLLLPDAGTATVDGFDVVHQMRDIRSRVGYMPGKFSLYQDLTVAENLEFFATLFGTTIDEGYDSIKAIYSQIERFKNRKAGALSGGMKQKLALSCALVHQPSILFLDEPTTGVDPVSRKEFWEMLSMLKERGITIVASTPYLDEVRQCERVAFLSEGKVQGINTPEIILDRFAHIFNPPSIEKGTASSPLGSAVSLSEGHSTHNSQLENVIEVSHLVKAFGSFHAVDDISFTVKRGEIFGFLGANGAGKTTAMHMLTGLNQPTSGTGKVAGYDIRTEHEQIKKHIGYMSQRFSLYEDLTVEENIRLFGEVGWHVAVKIYAVEQRLIDGAHPKHAFIRRVFFYRGFIYVRRKRRRRQEKLRIRRAHRRRDYRRKQYAADYRKTAVSEYAVNYVDKYEVLFPYRLRKVFVRDKTDDSRHKQDYTRPDRTYYPRFFHFLFRFYRHIPDEDMRHTEVA